MATLGSVKSFVRAWIPDRRDAAILAAANDVGEDFYARLAPRGTDTVTSTAPKTGGTVSVTAGSASVVGVGTNFVSADDAGQVIKIEGSDVLWRVDAVGGVTALTLSSAWDGEDGSGLEYTIYYPVLTLPTTVGNLDEIGRPNQPDLEHVADERRDEMGFEQEAGEPYAYADEAPASSGALKIRLIPMPDDAYAFLMAFGKRWVDLAADGDNFGLPPIFNAAISAAVLAHCYGQEDNTAKAGLWNAKAEARFMRARANKLGQINSHFRGIDESAVGTVIFNRTPVL